jgi:hypothetical protein
MNAHNIIIAGVSIAFDSSYQISQTYDPLGGVSQRRMMSGALNQQVHWRKRRTVINGSGRYPDGLDSINFDNAISISCMAPLSLSGASNVFTMPAPRRTDFVETGYALVGDRLVKSTVSVVANVATIGTVSGASGYQVFYYPILSCYAGLGVQRQFDGRGTVAGWSITAEEI